MVTDLDQRAHELLRTTEFTVKPEHLKLADAMWCSWDPAEFGAPAVDAKRPYGNSDVVGDILVELDIPDVDDEDDRPDELIEQAEWIHTEMAVVLQILLQHAEVGISPGRYRKRNYRWERVG